LEPQPPAATDRDNVHRLELAPVLGAVARPVGACSTEWGLPKMRIYAVELSDAIFAANHGQPAELPTQPAGLDAATATRAAERSR